MNTFLQFIHEYWYLIIAFTAIVSYVSIQVYLWFKQPGDKQKEQIREWLIFAVAEAEKKLGSGTGQLKLRYVYNMFIAKFPAVALFIDFEEFSEMVDQALEDLQAMMKVNEDIKKAVIDATEEEVK